MNEFRDCIAVNINEKGCARNGEFEIIEKLPVQCKPYRARNIEREEIRRIVSEWREAGIVRETNSAYAIPVLLVGKKNDEKRLVIDYRKFNAQTVRMSFPLPGIDDHLMEIGENNLFIALDLAHGYLQVPIAESSQS